MPSPDPNGGPCMPSHMHITFIKTTNEAKPLENQLQALCMWAMPLLAMLITEKDNKHQINLLNILILQQMTIGQFYSPKLEHLSRSHW